MPAAGSRVDQRRQPDRARPRGDGIRQLFHDARRAAGARARPQLEGRRSGLLGTSGRGAQLRLLEHAIRRQSVRDREEDPRQRRADGDRGCIREGFHRPRSGRVASDSGARADEGSDGPRLDLGSPGRSAHPMGSGLWTPEAWLYREISAGAAPGSLHAGSLVRDDAAGSEGLDSVPRAISS